MRILLINPPPYHQGKDGRYLERSPAGTYTMPLGLGCIASYLEREGYKTLILDAYVKELSFEEIRRFIEEYCPAVVGITCLSDQRQSWFALIRVIRDIDRGIRIVLGGPHPTLMPEQVLSHFRPDAIVLGEGERTMLELLRAWGENRDLRQVKGIAYMEGEKVVLTPQRERIEDLGTLPFPAHHMVDLNDYRVADFVDAFFKRLGFEKTPSFASITTARGCVGNCGFCSAPLIWKGQWTYRGAENVVDEIEMLNGEYGVDFIIITDDIFTVNQRRVISICKEILRRGLVFSWLFETAVKFVSPDLLHLAKQAGCCCIFYGVESGSKAILSTVSKNIRGKEVIDAFRMTRNAGILPVAYLMVGNPGETEKSINETIDLLRMIEPEIILPQIAMVTPRTRIFNLAKEKGFIDEGYWLTGLPFPYYTCERSIKTLLRWHRKLFYYRDSNFIVLLKTVRDYIEFHTGIRVNRTGFSKAEIPTNSSAMSSL
jgi:anaerobic magnesium-protoporphyrin IX monomethyl ester cyclase